ncbi:MAG: NAD(P)H-hydrate epimerase [Anaerolineales bacterium]
MAKIVTVEQMIKIEKAADASGLSYDQMMENAGQAVADTMLAAWPEIKTGMKILVLVGPGNNGGDGLVAGHYLAEAGAKVAIYLAKERDSGDVNLKRMAEHGGLIAEASQDQRYRVLDNLLETSDFILDGLLGTGFKLPLKGSLQKLMEFIAGKLERRQLPVSVTAIDCPSGLDCDTGEITPQAIPADITVTLAAAKPGLITFPGAEYVGDIVVADIGIAADQDEILSIDLDLATADDILQMLPERPMNAHKGTFGRALLVVGSANFPGAALLSGTAACRVGAGLVTLATPSVIQGMLVGQLPEATWILLPHEMGVIAEPAAEVLLGELGTYQAMLFGPGFGQETATRKFIQSLLSQAGPTRRGGRIGFVHPDNPSEMDESDVTLPHCVVDADGLKLLKQIDGWPKLLPPHSVLTPHPGEMSILTDMPIEEIQSERVATAMQWAASWNHVVVLKGAFTVVASPDGRATVIPFATPALATAGTGDVLAGAIVGLLVQGLQPYQAAVAGCWLHGRAGEIAAEWNGSDASVIAGDVAEGLIAALAEFEVGDEG